MANLFRNLRLEMYMKNVEFKRNPLFTHQCRLFQDIRYYAENIFVSLGNGIYISYFCAPMTVLKSNISLGTGDKKLMLASRGAGAPWCQKPSARNTHVLHLTSRSNPLVFSCSCGVGQVGSCAQG